MYNSVAGTLILQMILLTILLTISSAALVFKGNNQTSEIILNH